jgi:hypothetical protein
MVFASRLSQDFITPDQVARLENWTGKVSKGLGLPHLGQSDEHAIKAVLDALAAFEMTPEVSKYGNSLVKIVAVSDASP